MEKMKRCFLALILACALLLSACGQLVEQPAAEEKTNGELDPWNPTNVQTPTEIEKEKSPAATEQTQSANQEQAQSANQEASPNSGAEQSSSEEKSSSTATEQTQSANQEQAQSATQEASPNSGAKQSSSEEKSSSTSVGQTTPGSAAASTSQTSVAIARTVSCVFNYVADYVDENNNETHVHYQIPAFDANTADAKRLNEMMYKKIMDHVEREIAGIEGEEPFYAVCTTASYESYLNGDLLSVVAKTNWEGDIEHYVVANLDCSSGKEATRAQLLAAAGLSEKEFVERAAAAAGAYFLELFQNPDLTTSFIKERYEKTMAAENFGASLPLFFNGEGKLCMVTRIYCLAGTEFYLRIVTL